MLVAIATKLNGAFRPVFGLWDSFVQKQNGRRWNGFSKFSIIPDTGSSRVSRIDFTIVLFGGIERALLGELRVSSRRGRELWMCCCFMQTTVECFWLVGVLLCGSRSQRFGFQRCVSWVAFGGPFGLFLVPKEKKMLQEIPVTFLLFAVTCKHLFFYIQTKPCFNLLVFWSDFCRRCQVF